MVFFVGFDIEWDLLRVDKYERVNFLNRFYCYYWVIFFKLFLEGIMWEMRFLLFCDCLFLFGLIVLL